MAEKKKCDGRCCAAFNLPFSHEAWRNGAILRCVDGKFVTDILIPLTFKEAQERFRSLFTVDMPFLDDGYNSERMYTCRHWDPETRRCGEYESRPGVCRDYPNAGVCTYGCGYRLPEEEAVKFRRFEQKEEQEVKSEQSDPK